MLDPYSVLGVSPTASAEEIKAAYRRIARRLHPDANPNSPGAAVQFQDISAAYELLIDPSRRAEFDRSLPGEGAIPRFLMSLTPSKRAIRPIEEPQVIYLLAEIYPDVESLKSAPLRSSRLNLTLVLDHSNSMAGTRLDRVKVAAHQIIDQMTDEDILSVVTFSDRADIAIPATPVKDKAALKARVSMMVAGGGTEIFQGLQTGVEQARRYLAPRLVNHIILLTDGNTYGDEDSCIELALQASQDGIAISAMGLGQEWNDDFLDRLASVSGGTCRYITSSSAVARFLNDHVRTLSNVFAERLQVSAAPDPDIHLESVFKLAPSPQPLPSDLAYIPLGSLQTNKMISVLFQFEIPARQEVGFRSIGRIAAVGDILGKRIDKYNAVADLSVEVTESPPIEDPPFSILDALGKLTLYRMQERAQEALDAGNISEATQRLERLATRLIAIGETELAEQARTEAHRVSQTSHISDEGRKTLKFETRYLLLGPTSKDEVP